MHLCPSRQLRRDSPRFDTPELPSQHDSTAKHDQHTSGVLLLAKNEIIWLKRNLLLPYRHVHNPAFSSHGENGRFDALGYARAVERDVWPATFTKLLASRDYIFMSGIQDRGGPEMFGEFLSFSCNFSYNDLFCASCFEALNDSEPNRTGAENECVFARLDLCFSNCMPSNS